MLLVKAPTKRILVQTIDGVIEGRYSRDEVVSWCEAVVEQHRREGSDKLLVPLDVEEGYWYFVSMGILDYRDFEHKDEFFIRPGDLHEYLQDLKEIPCDEQQGPIRRLRVHLLGWSGAVRPLVMFRDDSTLNYRLTWVRGVFNNEGDLLEHTHFEYRDEKFRMIKQYDQLRNQLMLFGSSKDKGLIKELLSELNVGRDMIVRSSY